MKNMKFKNSVFLVNKSFAQIEAVFLKERILNFSYSIIFVKCHKKNKNKNLETKYGQIGQCKGSLKR